MIDWFEDKKTMQRTFNGIMGELELLLDELDTNYTANYWIDNTHNVFADIYKDGISYITIQLEMYDFKEELIGILYLTETEDMSRKELEKAVREIVEVYYRER
jgi:hypothetical protein